MACETGLLNENVPVLVTGGHDPCHCSRCLRSSKGTVGAPSSLGVLRLRRAAVTHSSCFAICWTELSYQRRWNMGKK